jgi:pilus assembly protein CpaF
VVELQIPDSLIELIDHPLATDILISEQSTQIDTGSGLEEVAPVVGSESEIQELARGLIELGGRRLDQSSPFADVFLPGGLRVHAVIKSGCSSSTLISIRLHSLKPLRLEDLVERNFINVELANWLQLLIAKRESFLISGATGSGKTTLLRAMLAETSERIICIEDVTEITGSNIISLQTRSPNIEGTGEVSMDRLVRESLRMRPDRLVVGEVRGSELVTMLQALNTGHCGASTIHANSLQKVPQRLYAIGVLGGLGEYAVARLAAAAIDWVIALSSGARRVSAIGKLELRSGELRVQPIEVGKEH